MSLLLCERLFFVVSFLNLLPLSAALSSAGLPSAAVCCSVLCCSAPCCCLLLCPLFCALCCSVVCGRGIEPQTKANIASLTNRAKDASAALEKERRTAAAAVVFDDETYAFNLIQNNLRPIAEESKGDEESKDEEESKEGDTAGESKSDGIKSKRRAYEMKAARMTQLCLENGLPLCRIGPLIMGLFRNGTGVELDTKNSKMKLHGKTAKLLALGVASLDLEELIKAILKAPFLMIAGDESLRKMDEKFPIFVAFWDVEAGKPWWGLLRMASMKDKTAETQAALFFDTIVNVLKYPRSQVMYVLSENTASVSGVKVGCVTKLQQKLRGEDTLAPIRGRGRSQRGGRTNGGGAAAATKNVRGRASPAAGRGRAARAPVRGRGRGRGQARAQARGRGRGRGRGESARSGGGRV